MLQTKNPTTRHSIVVSNKPGELAKLTKFLSDSSVKVSALQVYSVGNTASIQFSTSGEWNIKEELRKTGLSAPLEQSSFSVRAQSPF